MYLADRLTNRLTGRRPIGFHSAPNFAPRRPLPFQTAERAVMTDGGVLVGSLGRLAPEKGPGTSGAALGAVAGTTAAAIRRAVGEPSIVPTPLHSPDDLSPDDLSPDDLSPDDLTGEPILRAGVPE